MKWRSFREIFQAGRLVWLLLALILAANFVIRWHLRAMPLERDEGEYAYAGQLLLQGVPPYQIAWNMKFPGTYFAYAAIMAVFGQTPAGIHLGILVVTSLSIVLMFFIGRVLLDDFGGLMAAASFGALTALPRTYGLAGHATHFVVLFVCAGSCALLLAERKTSQAWLFVSGLAFGTAVLMKQHAAIFCVAGAAWICWQNWKSKLPWFKSMASFSGGAAAPLLLTAVALELCGVWKPFEFWTIEYARQYVSMMPLAVGLQMLKTSIVPIFSSSMWTWIAGLAALALIFSRTGHRRALAIGAGLFFAGVVAVCPGFYFRGHYFLMVMPGLALLVSTTLGELAAWMKKFPQIPLLGFLPVCLFLALIGEIFLRNGDEWFLSSPSELSRKIYLASPFPESTVVAAYIAAHSAPTDTVAVLGSEPQIFFLAHRRSATGFMYVYPLTENQPFGPQMREQFMREIEAARPKYVVYDNIQSGWCSTISRNVTDQALDQINSWWNAYAGNYTIVGEADISEDAPADFYWEDNLHNRTDTNRASLYILRRNDAAPKTDPK